MDILYLLVPLSVVLVLLIMGLFAWALQAGQFESLEHEGQRILSTEPEAIAPSGPAISQDRAPDSTVS